MQVEFILKSSYLDTETFRFDNKSCGSHTVTSEHVSLRTPLDACGTTKKDGEDSVTYFNKIVAETADKETIYIVEFPFSCTYGVRETIGSPSFQPRKKITYLKGKVQLLDSLSSSLRSASYLSNQRYATFPTPPPLPFPRRDGKGVLRSMQSLILRHRMSRDDTEVIKGVFD